MLEVAKTATTDQIKKAYFEKGKFFINKKWISICNNYWKIAKKFHPDHNPNDKNAEVYNL